jgi:hypothetical protein
MIVNMLVEGPLDEYAAAKIIQSVGHESGICYGKKGCDFIRDNIRRFNKAAHLTPYLTMVDFMDTGLPCPPEVVQEWLPHREPQMLFRLVVRELESWLLADRQGIADFLYIALNKVPHNPEDVGDPKQQLVNLARKSRSKSIRDALVPPPGSTAQVGRLYTSEIARFITSNWSIDEAKLLSPSLAKCISSLEALS